MKRLAALLLMVAALACRSADTRVMELDLSKEGGVTRADVARLERRVVAVRGVTLVSVNAARDRLIVHHRTDTDLEQIEAVLRESGFRWVEGN